MSPCFQSSVWMKYDMLQITPNDCEKKLVSRSVDIHRVQSHYWGDHKSYGSLNQTRWLRQQIENKYKLRCAWNANPCMHVSVMEWQRGKCIHTYRLTIKPVGWMLQNFLASYLQPQCTASYYLVALADGANVNVTRCAALIFYLLCRTLVDTS